MKGLVAGSGSVFGALLAHLPCCGSSVILALGGTGAGLGWLHALEPYRWFFIAFSTLTLGFGFWQAYRKPHACHSCGDCSSEVHARRRVKIGIMWVVAAISLSLVLVGFVNESTHDHDSIAYQDLASSSQAY